jgi:hypothetical protein
MPDTHVLDAAQLSASIRKHLRPETLALHVGSYDTDPATGAVVVPFPSRDASHAFHLFPLLEPGSINGYLGNPTVDALETRIAELEGGMAAVSVAPGHAASICAMLSLAQSGDNIVSSTDVCSGTWALFAATLGRSGVEARFVDPADPEAFARASDDRTRAWYAETLPNPKLEVFPIAEVAAIGRKLGIPLIMDNTAVPLLARPFDHGAAVVVQLDHEIYRRPRHNHWRHHRRRRQFPMGSAPRSLPVAVGTPPGGSRRQWDQWQRTARADDLCRARPRDLATGYWRRGVAG